MSTDIELTRVTTKVGGSVAQALAIRSKTTRAGFESRCQQ
jgi:hypothetical protein